jgi:plastocyanin
MIARPSPPPSSRRAARARAGLALALVPLAALSFPAPPLPAAPGHALEGVVELREAGQPTPGAAAVITFEPEGGAQRVAPRAAEIVTHEKRFLPRVLVVPARSSVAFPNHDPIYHNVFSVSPGNRFDLGRYREGQTRSARFDTPGLVRVFCNVHEQMVAYVMVVETPFHAVADAQGRFRLEDLPSGRGTVVAWHERSASVRIPVELPAQEPLRIRLDAARARDVAHLNKFGRPYGTGERDESYR